MTSWNPCTASASDAGSRSHPLYAMLNQAAPESRGGGRRAGQTAMNSWGDSFSRRHDVV